MMSVLSAGARFPQQCWHGVLALGLGGLWPGPARQVAGPNLVLFKPGGRGRVPGSTPAGMPSSHSALGHRRSRRPPAGQLGFELTPLLPGLRVGLCGDVQTQRCALRRRPGSAKRINTFRGRSGNKGGQRESTTDLRADHTADLSDKLRSRAAAQAASQGNPGPHPPRVLSQPDGRPSAPCYGIGPAPPADRRGLGLLPSVKCRIVVEGPPVPAQRVALGRPGQPTGR